MPFELTMRKNRTREFNLALIQADDTDFNLAAGDVVRVKLYRGDQATPDLEIDSVAATANGSVVTFTSGTNDALLRVDQGDVDDWNVSPYMFEIDVVDDSDDDKIKFADDGVLHLLESAGGDVGLA